MYRLSGKLCSQKQYETHLQRVAAAAKAREARARSPKTPKRRLSPNSEDWEDLPSKRFVPVEKDDQENASACSITKGRRIVEIYELGRNLWCCSCKECLSLQYVEKETRRGLGSVLSIRCHKCAVINVVPTGKQHPGPTGRIGLFDINSKAVLGCYTGGCSYAHLEKLMATLNMPNMDRKTYKRYEREFGPKIEKVAKDSCGEAAREEREQTIQNKDIIEQIL